MLRSLWNGPRLVWRLVQKHNIDPYTHLRSCTVRVRIGARRGTGFFVAPGRVITCAHVLGTVGVDAQEISIGWNGIEHPGTLINIFPDPCPERDVYPDIAVIQIEELKHPHVVLHTDCAVGDKVLYWAFSSLRKGGESCEGVSEGEARYDEENPDTWLIKFKTTQVLPGMSGAPLLNLSRREVCGMVKRTRDDTSDLGGLAIRADTIYKYVTWLKRPPKKRKLRAWLVVAGAALLVLLISLGYLLTNSSKASRCLPLRAANVFAQTTNTRPALVRIPEGDFLMGRTPGDPYKEAEKPPPHRVSITRPFLISATEITQAQYYSVLPDASRIVGKITTKHNNKCEQFGVGPQLPIYCVSWLDAIRYCNKLSELEGLEPSYEIGSTEIRQKPNALGYRLPTEAEWEYAARADCNTVYVGGDSEDYLKQSSWYRDNSDGGVHTVGILTPNAWGLYDMTGNVWEWVWDWDGPVVYSTEVDPLGPREGQNKVWRGGSWYCEKTRVSLAWRWVNPVEFVAGDTGFRIARSLK